MEEKNASLEEKNASLEEKNASLEERLSNLENELAILKGEKEPPNDWHSMMYLILSIALHGIPVDLRREIVLGAMPPRSDFLIRKDDPGVNMKLGIFNIFLKMNIVEFKGPGDDLGEAELWQADMYLGAQARKSLLEGEATSDDFTITLFREAKPEKLLKQLGDKAKEDAVVKGVYHIEGWKLNVPMQIVVTRELKGEEYAGFRAISTHPALEDIRTLMEKSKNEGDAAVRDSYRDFFRLLMKVDRAVVEEAKRRYPEMAEAWMEIFAPEIKEREIRAAVNAIIDFNHCDMDVAVSHVAKKHGMTVDEVKAILDKKKEAVAV